VLPADRQGAFFNACEQLENTVDREINEATSEWISYLTEIAIAYRKARGEQEKVLKGMLRSAQAEEAALNAMLSLILPALTGAFVGALVSYGGRVVLRKTLADVIARKKTLTTLLDSKGGAPDFLQPGWQGQASEILSKLDEVTRSTSERVAIHTDIVKSAVADIAKNIVKEKMKPGFSSPYESAGPDAEELSDLLRKLPHDWRNLHTEEKQRRKQRLSACAAANAVGPNAIAEFNSALQEYAAYLQSVRCSDFVLNAPTMTGRGLLDPNGMLTVFEVMLWVQWARMRDLPYWKKRLADLHDTWVVNIYTELACKDLRHLIPIEQALVTRLQVPLVTVSTLIPDDLLQGKRPHAPEPGALLVNPSNPVVRLVHESRPFSFRYLNVFKLANLPSQMGSHNSVLMRLMNVAWSGEFTINALRDLRDCTTLI